MMVNSPREVALHREIGEAGFDRCVHADDVADGGGGRDGHAIAVAHAVLGNAGAQRGPVHGAGHVDFQIT